MELPNDAPPDRHHRFAAFDIGGTWFRSGRVDIDTMSASSMKQRPAISWSAHPELPPEDLERRLVDWLACEARRLIGEGGGRAAVSLGAAMNEQSGWVHGSGPLWGPRSKPFDLLARLQEAAPDLSWTVVNDLTAAILQASRHVAPEDRKMMLVTVSSGVAARILDRRSARLPAEEATGLQGEIGHLPVAPLRAFGHEITLDCACGGAAASGADDRCRGRLVRQAGSRRLPAGGSKARCCSEGLSGLRGRTCRRRGRQARRLRRGGDHRRPSPFLRGRMSRGGIVRRCRLSTRQG